MNPLPANLRPWLPMPDDWQAQKQTVDIFAIDLSQPPIPIDRARHSLTDAERQSMDRFKSPTKQREFAITRAMLRMILASVIRTDPLALALAFEHTAHGKPLLPNHPVHFNVTHSHQIALIAVSPDLPLGVDIEYVQGRRELIKLAQRFFAPAEYEAILAMDPTCIEQAFHATWTRKEAFVKAVGQGIALGLDRFEVSVDPTTPAMLHKVPPEITTPWNLLDLAAPAVGYRACLCVAHACPNLHCWQIASTFNHA